jgi:hypothetical protein
VRVSFQHELSDVPDLATIDSIRRVAVEDFVLGYEAPLDLAQPHLVPKLGGLVGFDGQKPLISVSRRYRRLKNRFSFFNKIGKPLHTTGHQGWWRFIHGLDRRP